MVSGGLAAWHVYRCMLSQVAAAPAAITAAAAAYGHLHHLHTRLECAIHALFPGTAPHTVRREFTPFCAAPKLWRAAALGARRAKGGHRTLTRVDLKLAYLAGICLDGLNLNWHQCSAVQTFIDPKNGAQS